MALLRHKGGSLSIPGTDIVIHYGPGLHKACPTCKVDKHVPCVTDSGKPLKKLHKSRED
jgi:hypothetical protein